MDNFEESGLMLEKEAEAQNGIIKTYKRKSRALAVTLALLFVLVSGFVILGMFAENVYFYTGIEGPSMKPTINAEAQGEELEDAYDYAYVNTYQKGDRDDIIVVSHTSNNGQTQYVIKRLIGVAGDIITIDNTDLYETKVYRNGELLAEEYLDRSTNSKFAGIGGSGTIAREFGITEIEVPEGYIFYMGDNRNNSTDCRDYSYTEVPYCESVDNIIGRVDYIIPYASVEEGDGKDFERFINGLKEIFASIF